MIEIALASGLGAIARFKTDEYLVQIKGLSPYMSVSIINALACFVLAIALALLHHTSLSSSLPYITTGFLSGYSTFSTALLLSWQRLYEKSFAHALTFTFGMFMGCTSVFYCTYATTNYILMLAN